MATYRDIKGDLIETVASDPSNPIEGDIWYNTTTGTLKGLGFKAAAWASGGNLPQNRQNVEGVGTSTAGLAIGGATGPATPAFLGTSCEYDGTSWSPTTSMGGTDSISEGCFGTQTAAVATGGYGDTATTLNQAREYNGTSWSSITNLPQATRGAMGTGAETSGLITAGEESTVLTNTQEYNGSSWTAGGAIPTATYNAAAGGTSESNSWFAGGADSFKNGTFIYNGSTWTSSGNLNTARDQVGGSGIQTAALAFGGRVPPNNVTNVTESFDGSSWTTIPATLGTSAKQAAAFGTQTSAIYAGNDPAAAITQEFTGAGTENKTVTTST